MRILLTGGAGFIGTAVLAELHRRGHDVRVLDSLRPDVHREPPSIEGLIRADVRDPGAVEQALRDVDAVCHLAAKVGLGVDVQDLPDYADSNVHGTAVLLAAMARTGVRRLTLASSMVVYGEGVARCEEHGLVPPAPRERADLERGEWEPHCRLCQRRVTPILVEEGAPFEPRNAYADSKTAQELFARSWARATDRSVAALRYHNVYGPGMPVDTPYAGVAAIFTSALRRGEAPRVFEDGAQRRDFIHVADVASATVDAVEQHTDGVRPFNVGSGTPRTVGDMAHALAAALQGPEPVVTAQFRVGDVRHITADSSRIRRELGWEPKVDFTDGMAQLAQILGR